MNSKRFCSEHTARELGILVTRDRLFELVILDRETGVFRHRNTGYGKRAGMVAGSPDKDGYFRMQVDKVTYMRHRLVWFCETEEWPVNDLDHKDRTPGHDWFDNLRPATKTQNMQNRSIQKNNIARAKGVYYSQKFNHYTARIVVQKKLIHIGTFKTMNDAAEAYRRAAKENFGEFAVVEEF